MPLWMCRSGSGVHGQWATYVAVTRKVLGIDLSQARILLGAGRAADALRKEPRDRILAFNGRARGTPATSSDAGDHAAVPVPAGAAASDPGGIGPATAPSRAVRRGSSPPSQAHPLPATSAGGREGGGDHEGNSAATNFGASNFGAAHRKRRRSASNLWCHPAAPS